jgi:hypothetical protein
MKLIGKKVLFIVLLVISALVFLAGVSFLIMYVWNGVITRIGEPDQSLIFWYLPILFMGLIGMGIGWAMGVRMWQLLKEHSSRDI